MPAACPTDKVSTPWRTGSKRANQQGSPEADAQPPEAEILPGGVSTGLHDRPRSRIQRRSRTQFSVNMYAKLRRLVLVHARSLRFRKEAGPGWL